MSTPQFKEFTSNREVVETFKASQRVALHPCTDEWMRGNRYGTINRVTSYGRVLVDCDRDGKAHWIHPNNLAVLPDEQA